MTPTARLPAVLASVPYMAESELNALHRYPATLRDADNRILSTGEALFDTSKHFGEFWPKTAISADLLLPNAKTVQTSEGHALRIDRIWECQAEYHHAIHFEFEWSYEDS
jgi:hypothetical protein